MGDVSCTIERKKNGYTIRMKDPKIVKANNQRPVGSKSYTPYRDPWVEYVFTEMKDVVKFLEANLETALPEDDYTTSFDAAIAEEDDDDD